MSLKEKLEAATHPHTKQPVYQNAPTQDPSHSSRKVQLTITLPSISVHATKDFQAKLPLLLLLLLIFSFSLIMFEKANFHSTDLVDFNRLKYNIIKFWSISFIVFLLLFALALAIAVFFGFGQNLLLASIVLPITVIPAVVISLFFPNALMLPFLVFAFTVSSASLVASLYSQDSQNRFTTIWSALGIAMLLFAVLTFTVSFVKLASNKDAYINQFVESGITATAGSIQGLSITGASSSLQSQSLDIASLLTPEAVKSAVTRDKIAKIITTERVRAALFQGIPGWNSIANRSVFEENVRQKLIDDVYANVGTDIPAMLSGLRSETRVQTGAATPAPLPSISPSMKELLGRMPWFVTFYNNFSLLMAILVTSVATFFIFIARIFAALFAWLLAKFYY